MQLKKEKDLLAEVIYKEARGEGLEGMEAVANVIVNRSKAWGRSLTKCILGKNQFSSMSVPSDPQYGKPCPLPDDQGGLLWAKAVEVAERVCGEMTCPDPTLGALYYANLATATSGWFFKNIVQRPDLHPLTVKIGHHSFFK